MFWGTCVSALSFLFYYERSEILLYGDAIAHINIARRVFDSITPGPLQLGTVWLPLPHLLMMPFLISDRMWQSGIGGSIPSMAGYVLGAVGIFRLVRGALSRNGEFDLPCRLAAWVAALIYAANPNLIYLQTTAMGEAVYLAFFIWAVVYFSEFIRGESKALIKCGLCLAAACLTRYDGWFLAAVMGVAVVIVAFVHRPAEEKRGLAISRHAVIKFIVIVAAAPVLWLAYNGIIYRNPLEFENGPYSAKAIEQKTQNSASAGHPGSGNLPLAALYFLKSGESNVAVNQWVQRMWIALACAAIAAGLLRRRGAALLLLLVPLPFYALSVAYGGVPIFVPQWWPFSHYNVRYGVELLPAFAAAIALLVHEVAQLGRWRRGVRAAFVLGVIAFVAVSYAFVWRAGPVSLKEAQINMRNRNQLESQLASFLKLLPPDSTLLMYLGDHVGALEKAGLPLRRVINEGNHRVWMQPRDPDGLWERALADPVQHVNYVIAFEGDPVWQAVQGRHLRELVEIHVTGQARAILYRVR